LIILVNNVGAHGATRRFLVRHRPAVAAVAERQPDVRGPYDARGVAGDDGAPERAVITISSVNAFLPDPGTALWLGPDGVAATVAKATGVDRETARKQVTQEQGGLATGRFTRPDEVADLRFWRAIALRTSPARTSSSTAASSRRCRARQTACRCERRSASPQATCSRLCRGPKQANPQNEDGHGQADRACIDQADGGVRAVGARGGDG
jgi:hypothetical protein